MSFLKRFVVFLLIVVLLCSSLNSHALSVSARAAVVIDGISGKVLYSVNPKERLSMASTTKIMTALILCEQEDLTRQITVTEEMIRVEGTSMGLSVGIKVTLYDLLYGMLLSSGNDAANAAAVSIGGSMDGFVALMNRKAAVLGLVNTHFDTPSGLDGPTHYTTAYDLAMLTGEALKNEAFAKAAQTKSITLTYGGMRHTLTNHNRLLSTYSGAVGVKTGFTKKSGRCLVSAAKREEGLVIAVTLNDGNDWQDHKAMLDYGFTCLSDSPQSFASKSYTVAVHGGETDRVTAKSDEVAFRTAKGESVREKEYILPYISAPISAGEAVGYIEYYCGQNLVAKQTLTAGEAVNALPQTDFIDLFLISFKKLLKCI